MFFYKDDLSAHSELIRLYSTSYHDKAFSFDRQDCVKLSKTKNDFMPCTNKRFTKCIQYILFYKLLGVADYVRGKSNNWKELATSTYGIFKYITESILAIISVVYELLYEIIRYPNHIATDEGSFLETSNSLLSFQVVKEPSIFSCIHIAALQISNVLIISLYQAIIIEIQ